MTQFVAIIICIVIGYTIAKATGSTKKGIIWGGILIAINFLHAITR